MNSRTKDSLYGIIILFAVILSMSAFAQYGQDIDHHKVGNGTTIESTELKVDTAREVATAKKAATEEARLKKLTRDIKRKAND